jgi:hypothetical protein
MLRIDNGVSTLYVGSGVELARLYKRACQHGYTGNGIEKESGKTYQIEFFPYIKRMYYSNFAVTAEAGIANVDKKIYRYRHMSLDTAKTIYRARNQKGEN